MSSLRARRIARNPFAFPGGNPGFNPAHLAAQNARFSAVSIGANFFSLIKAAKGTIVGTPASAINSAIGPTTVFNNGGSTDRLTYSGVTGSVTEAQMTLAALIYPTGVAAANNYIINTASTNGYALVLNTATFRFNRFGGTGTNSSINLSANVPYFVAASTENSAVTAFVVRRLDNGALSTDTKTAGAGVSSDGTYIIGNSPVTTTSFTGQIAAVMASATYMPLPMLVQWSSDPFSFWYPQ